MKKVAKTITIRLMPLNTEAKLSKKELVKWFAVTIGLISPRETRDSILFILDKLLEATYQGGISIQELLAKSKQASIDEKTVYYHLNKLKKLGLLCKVDNKYKLGYLMEEDLRTFIKKYYIRTLKEALEIIDEAFNSIEQFYAGSD